MPKPKAIVTKEEPKKEPKRKRVVKPTTPMPVEVVEQEQPATEVQAEDTKVKRPLPKLNMRWVWLVVGILGIVAGGGVGVVWFQTTNIVLGLLTLVSIGSGVFLTYRQIRNVSTKSTTIIVKTHPGGNGHKPEGGTHVVEGGVINSWNFYSALNDDGVLETGVSIFESMANPLGQPREILELGESYYFHLWFDDIKKWKRLIIKDTKYIDPAVVAGYLDSVPIKNYLKMREDWKQYIGPGVMVVMNIIGLIGIVMVMGD